MPAIPISGRPGVGCHGGNVEQSPRPVAIVVKPIEFGLVIEKSFSCLEMPDLISDPSDRTVHFVSEMVAATALINMVMMRWSKVKDLSYPRSRAQEYAWERFIPTAVVVAGTW
jgi:hypothetical protein